MTKKLLLKLNMAIVFVVILFASVSFAEDWNADQIVNYMSGKFNETTGTATLGDLDRGRL